ncbi:hypothetical protein QVD17_25019 [Tagetes erecta]|uniref:Uncharacterized protein n=1 Tax=Tagetes erecta TaxID=13708 RepID=A0AAD8KIJ7_TARER|nr:hypothetical protein QVD17_25019 [Tagetes erecta]
MATNLHSDHSGTTTTTTSPRISFSYDLSQSDTVPVEQLIRSCSSSSVDFNFCIHENPDVHHASVADELFFDGKIRPMPIKSKSETYKLTPSTPPLENKKSKSSLLALTLTLKPMSSPVSSPAVENVELKLKHQTSKSFWGFKRSSSCGNGYARSLCPITLLSRSSSMGSSTSLKQSSSPLKEGLNQKHHHNVQKPTLKKSYCYGNYTSVTAGNGIRVDPVLNLGFGSFFSSNSKKRNKK